MASNGDGRSGLLTAGGILSILGGVLEVILGLIAAGLAVGIRIGFKLIPGVPFRTGDWLEHVLPVLSSIPIWLLIAVGGALFVLGVVAIVGGVSGLRRSSFGLSLAGAICALPPPTILLGILSVIFVSVSKKDFEAG